MNWPGGGGVFGLGIEHLLILLVAGLFILGPERLPAAAAWLGRTVRQVREVAAGAHRQMRAEIGPEFDELRKPLEDLRALRELDPRTAFGRYLLDDRVSPDRNGHTVPPRPANPTVAGQRSPIDPDAT